MRSLLSNQQPVFYKLYLGEEDIIDQDGNLTGSTTPLYGELRSCMICVSPNKGASEASQFGSFADYDRTMTTSDTSLPIDENTVLWVGDADTNGPYSSIVKRRAQWKNSLQFAIKNVTVSMYQQEQARIKAAGGLV